MSAVTFLVFVLYVEGIRGSLMCTVSVYQNQSVAYSISEALPAPDCSVQWSAANTVLVDERGGIHYEIVLHSEPQRIVTKDCQHDVKYRLDCQTPEIFSVVKCNYTCPIVAPVGMVAKDYAVVKPLNTSRTHVVTYAVVCIALLLGFVLTAIIIYKYRHLREPVDAV